MYHEHPLRILRYSMKNIWLLIFPLIRGITAFKFNPLGIYAWIKGAWMDIAVLGVILIYGYVRWYFSVVTVTDTSMIHQEGVFVKIKRTIPRESISALTAERAFYLVPLRAVTFSCDTRAGIFKSTDLKIMVTNKVGNELMKCLPDIKAEDEIKDIPKPDLRSVLLFSVFFSSGFSGAVYMAALLYKGGDIVQNIISAYLGRVTATTEHITSKVLHGIPQAAIAVGAFFIAAWLLSFVTNIMRYAHFQLTVDDEHINISCGLVKRRQYKIRRSHINYTDMRQNLIMKLADAVTVNISCPGYGLNSHLPVLMPIKRKKNLGDSLGDMGVMTVGRAQYKPKWTSFFGYAGIPACCVVLVFVLYTYAEKLPVTLSGLVLFLVIMSEIPLAWLTAVKTVALSTSGISLTKEQIVVQCCKWFAFHTYIADRGNVVAVDVKQSIFQIPWKKCNVVIWLCGESRCSCMVRSLKLEDGLAIAETLKHDIVKIHDE